MRRRFIGFLIAGLSLLNGIVVSAGEGPAEEANALVSQERYAEAVPRFQAAISKDPKNASLHLGLGLALQSLGRYADAIAFLEKASKLAPGSSEAFYSLGLLYEAAAADPTAVGAPKSDAIQGRYWQKAHSAWERVARLSKDPKRIELAKEHLARISEVRK